MHMLKKGRLTIRNLQTKEMNVLFHNKALPIVIVQGWHILRIIFKKSSPADKIGLNWRKLDKSGEKGIKLILTIVKG